MAGRVAARAAREADVAESIDVLIAVAQEPDSLVGTIDRAKRDEIISDICTWVRDDTNGVIVAVAEDRVVGSLHIIAGDGIGEVRLNVAAAWRSRGAGTLMLEAAEAWARRKGLHKLWMKVHAPNTRAIALYERCGYEHEGLLRRNYRDEPSGEFLDTVLMGRLLDQ